MNTKSILMNSIESLETDMHLVRLRRFSRIKTKFTESQEVWLKQMLDSNFVWVVKSGTFVPKFSYAASLSRNHSSDPAVIAASGARTAVVYSGDIPNFALDRLDEIVRLNPYSYLTIHSCLPIPVILELSPRAIDPVVVCWKENPEIWVNKKLVVYSWRELLYKGWGNSDMNGSVGVVVSAWDLEKEISLY